MLRLQGISHEDEQGCRLERVQSVVAERPSGSRIAYYLQPVWIGQSRLNGDSEDQDVVPLHEPRRSQSWAKGGAMSLPHSVMPIRPVFAQRAAHKMAIRDNHLTATGCSCHRHGDVGSTAPARTEPEELKTCCCPLPSYSRNRSWPRRSSSSSSGRLCPCNIPQVHPIFQLVLLVCGHMG